jgi:hypothetical protein
MSCRACLSGNQRRLSSEMNIHFPGMKGLDKPTVWAFPELLVCLDCGFTEFQVEETELRLLAEGIAGIKDEGAVA